jgi:hypothetical protein
LTENNQDGWEEGIAKLTHLKNKGSGNMSPLFDENLRYFFKLEEGRKENRISTAAGQGIY